MGKNDNKEAIEKLRKKIRRLQGKEQHEMIEISYERKSENMGASLLISNK